MARVTVEDCVDKVNNRFDLVLLAAYRARTISNGAELLIDRGRDKNPVVALREIAERAVPADDLREELIHSLQKYVEVDEPDSDRDETSNAFEEGTQPPAPAEAMSEQELLRFISKIPTPQRNRQDF